MISATQLYDFVHCPHRVSMDAFGDATERDETSPFVEPPLGARPCSRKRNC